MKKPVNAMRYLPFLITMMLLPFLMGAATNMIDPTRPPDIIFSPKSYSSNQPLKVTAIYVHSNYRLAIINGQVVKTGDHLGEFTITTINPYTVELTGSQNNQLVLPLTVTIKQQK